MEEEIIDLNYIDVNKLTLKEILSSDLEKSINHNIPLDICFYEEPYNSIRRAKIILFCSCLSHYDKFINMPYQDKTNLLKQVELSCFNYTKDKADKENIVICWLNDLFLDIYHSICYKISANLDPTSLVGIRAFGDNLLNNVISPDNICNISSKDICPEKYIEIEKKIELKRNIKYHLNTSKIYTCHRCGNKETIIDSLQLRSLDESNDIFATCIKCGNKWKV